MYILILLCFMIGLRGLKLDLEMKERKYIDIISIFFLFFLKNNRYYVYE